MTEKKRIAYVSLNQFNPYLADGVSRAMVELLLFLEEQGDEVSIINFFTNDPNKKIFISDKTSSGGVDYDQEILPFPELELSQEQPCAIKTIISKIRKHGINFIFTADEGFLPLFCAWLMRIQGVHFFHSPSYIERFIWNPLNIKFLQTRIIFASSKFTQMKIKGLLNLDAVVCYPLGDINTHAGSESSDRFNTVGFYSGGRHKGDEIVNRIIRRMPDNTFIVIGRNYHNQPGPPVANLRDLGDISDMKSFYRQIKLLLVPSIIEEGFPRMILEAAVNGIPAIANRVGGIPESLGDSGILIDVDLGADMDMDKLADQYVREIGRLLGDEDLYHGYSSKALSRAKEYQIEQTAMTHAVYERYIK